MTTTTKIIIGLTAAAAAGAAVGILLAPEKGTDFQRKLKACAKDWLTGIMALVESTTSTSETADNTSNDRVEISDAPEISTVRTSRR